MGHRSRRPRWVPGPAGRAFAARRGVGARAGPTGFWLARPRSVIAAASKKSLAPAGALGVACAYHAATGETSALTRQSGLKLKMLRVFEKNDRLKTLSPVPAKVRMQLNHRRTRRWALLCNSALAVPRTRNNPHWRARPSHPQAAKRLPRRARPSTMTMAIAVPTATAIDELSVGRGELVRTRRRRRRRGAARHDAEYCPWPRSRRFPTGPVSVAAGPDLGFGSTAIRGWVASTSDPTPGPYQPVTTLIHRGGSVSGGSGGFCSGTVGRPSRRGTCADAGAGLLRRREEAPPPEVERKPQLHQTDGSGKDPHTASGGTSACPVRACT